MEPISANQICSNCHQPIYESYYFCPNCGIKLRIPQLVTSFRSQLSLYTLSIILPSLAFLFITKWRGLDYVRSPDKKTKTIGMVACVLLCLSTIITLWYTYTISQTIIQSARSNISTIDYTE